MEFTYNKEKEFKPLEAGDYEAYLESYKFETLQSGRNLIRLSFKIRDDVEQEGQNRTVFDVIWSKKDNNEEYITFKVMALIGAVDPNLEDGTTFSTLEEALKYCVGKPLIIYVKQRTNNSTGNIENEISKYKVSANPTKSLLATNSANEGIDLDDDELPF